MEQLAPIINGSIHLLAAAVILGGSFASKFLIPRATAGLDPKSAGAFNETFGKYFSMAVWISLALLLLTGVARSFALGALNPDVLFSTTYGTILLVKIVLTLVGVAISVLIPMTGMKVAALAQNGGQPDQIRATSGRLSTLQLVGLIDVTIIIVLAVALRVIGVPGAE